MDKIREDEIRQYCDMHNKNMGDLFQHKTQWTLLKYFGAIFLSSLLSFCIWQYKQVRNIEEVARSLDKTVNSFIQVAKEQKNRIEDKIIIQEQFLKDHEARIRLLERRNKNER